MPGLSGIGAAMRATGMKPGRLAIERDHVTPVPVQFLAAGQAPGPARHLAALAGDPEPGRVLPAVNAELDGARQQAGRGHRAPPGCGHGGGGQAPAVSPAGPMADGYARGRRYVQGQPLDKAVAPWPAGPVHGHLLTSRDRAWPADAG